jgi:hypothetical protein
MESSSDTSRTKTYFYDSDVTIEKFKPKVTRDICSVFEFVRVVTDLANHLYTLPSIEKYIDGIEIKNIVEPCDLAYKLLRNGRFNAILDRGTERVTFSELHVDPFTYELVESYLAQQEDTRHKSFLEKLDLLG